MDNGIQPYILGTDTPRFLTTTGGNSVDLKPIQRHLDFYHMMVQEIEISF